MFFCRDDISLHSCFFVERSNDWFQFNWETNRDNLIQQYEKLFHKTTPDMLCGEGSTTYMPSKKAPERIASLIPSAKIIFILRNPIERAYSAYWHYVYKGMISQSFTNQIRFDGLGILSMGLYEKQIKHYMNYFPREQLHFVIFEAFKSNKQTTIDNILQFLNVDGKIDVQTSNEKTNRANVPLFPRTQFIINAVRKNLGARYAAEDQFNVTTHEDKPFFRRILSQTLDYVSKHNFRKSTYTKMDKKIRSLLEEYYQRENRNLTKTIGIDVKKYWNY